MFYVYHDSASEFRCISLYNDNKVSILTISANGLSFMSSGMGIDPELKLVCTLSHTVHTPKKSESQTHKQTNIGEGDFNRQTSREMLKSRAYAE